jgi:hypothetical protein
VRLWSSIARARRAGRMWWCPQGRSGRRRPDVTWSRRDGAEQSSCRSRWHAPRWDVTWWVFTGLLAHIMYVHWLRGPMLDGRGETLPLAAWSQTCSWHATRKEAAGSCRRQVSFSGRTVPGSTGRLCRRCRSRGNKDTAVRLLKNRFAGFREDHFELLVKSFRSRAHRGRRPG